MKHTVTSKPTGAHDSAIRQLISQAIADAGTVDIFHAAGLKSPSVAILDDDFLHELQSMPQKDLALEALRRLLNDEIKVRSRKNIVEARSFRAMLEDAILRYQNMAINAAQVIEEMIQLARRLKESAGRGEKLGLTDEEVAFYDALAHHETSREVLGDQNLYLIAREVAKSIKANVSIDWIIKESVRETPISGQTRPAKTWLPARQARVVDGPRDSTSGVALCRTYRLRAPANGSKVRTSPFRGCTRRGRGEVRHGAGGELSKRSRHAVTLPPGRGARTRDRAAA